MGLLDGPSAGHKLMMQRLEAQLRFLCQGQVRIHRPGPGRTILNRINLVKRQPVFHDPLIPVKQDGRVPQKGLDRRPAGPAVLFQGQPQRRLKMGDCDHWFDAVSAAFGKHRIIETQPGFVGFSVVPLGKDPRPGDR